MGQKSKKHAFNPPLRTPQNVNMQALIEMRKAHEKDISIASNNTFNLALSACIIAVRDMGMGVGQAQEFIERVFGVLDDVADGLAKIDQMLDLVKGWGIKVYENAEERLEQNGKTLAGKTAVFEILESGQTEIEEILNKCKKHNIDVTYRDVCSYMWEFNKNKYYNLIDKNESKKEEAFRLLDCGANIPALCKALDVPSGVARQYLYLWQGEERGDTMASNTKKAFGLISRGASPEELVKEMGITEAAALRFIDAYNKRNAPEEDEPEVVVGQMRQAFDLFDKGYGIKHVMSTLDIGKATAETYKSEWIRVNKKELSVDEMADVLADIHTIDTAILRHKGVLDKPSIPKDKGLLKGQAKEQHETQVKAKNQVKVNENKNEEVESMAKGKKGLVKVVKVVEIKGDIATYIPQDNDTFNITLRGTTIALSKGEIKDFSEELEMVLAEEI